MDSLTYYYNTGTNRLNHVKDSVPAGTYTSEQDNLIKDISTQPSNNYCYDAIGNLIKDSAEKITSIKWNVYGKIIEINRIATADVPATKIQYSYDAAGNRISQITTTGDNKYYTWYVRDAQGNLLTTYSATGTDSDLDELELQQSEKYMYGSSRLGVLRVDEDVDNDNAGPGSMQYYDGNGFDRGGKAYELTNHLGNVLATISDRKFPVPSVSNSSLIDHYDPHIVNAQDYYPFGMMSRVALPNNGQTYRFGFNGQEMNNDIKGLGNSYTAEFWEYDSRVARRWNIDPMNMGGTSGYATLGNNPLIYTDPFGLDTVKSSNKARVGDVFQHKKGNSNFFWNKTSSGFEGGGSSESLSTVVVTAKKRHYFKMINWPDVKPGQLAFSDKMYARIRDGAPLHDPSDPPWAKEQIPFHLQNYQAQEDGRMLQGIFLGAMATPVVITGLAETGAASYLIPRFGFSPGGAAADIINQKVIQGKSWADYNLASTITNGFFGGGSLVTNALWGSSGSFVDLSLTAVRNNTVFKINNDRWVSFKAGFIGNMVGGGLTFGFNKMGGSIITNGSLYTRTAGYILYNGADAGNALFGNLISNKVEEGLKQ